MITRDNDFYLAFRGDKLIFRTNRWYWSSNGERGLTMAQVKLASFLFDELLPNGIFFDSTNFLLTTKWKRDRVENKLRLIVADNEW